MGEAPVQPHRLTRAAPEGVLGNRGAALSGHCGLAVAVTPLICKVAERTKAECAEASGVGCVSEGYVQLAAARDG